MRCGRGGSLGFVADERRLNVMITRARRGLVLFGDASTLEADETWRAYLRWIRQRHCFVPHNAAGLLEPGEARGEAAG